MSVFMIELSGIAKLFFSLLCPLFVLLVVSWVGGQILFLPLTQRGVWSAPRMRFHIGDILILLVQLQVGGAITFTLFYTLTRDEFGGYVLAGIACVLMTWWWLLGVRMLERARVRRGKLRLFFLGVVVPIGYLGVLGVLASPAFFGVLIFLIASLFTSGETAFLLPLIVLVLAGATVVVANWWVLREARRIVDLATDDNALNDGIAFDALRLLTVDERMQRHRLARQAAAINNSIAAAAAADESIKLDDITVIDEK